MSDEKKREDKETNPVIFCLRLGIFAGIIWGTLRWLLYSIKFTGVLPGFLAEPFFRHSFMVTGWGHAVGILHFIVFSIVAAFLYKLAFGRLKGPWAGLYYGLVWWTILFLWLGPVLDMMKPVNRMGWNTLTAELCVFLMWGLFIGYTIAFEYTDEASREPVPLRKMLLKP